MGLRLEKRREPSRAMLYLAPVLAVLMTMVAGAGVFTVIGVHGVEDVTQPLQLPVPQRSGHGTSPTSTRSPTVVTTTTCRPAGSTPCRSWRSCSTDGRSPGVRTSMT